MIQPAGYSKRKIQELEKYGGTSWFYQSRSSKQKIEEQTVIYVLSEALRYLQFLVYLCHKNPVQMLIMSKFTSGVDAIRWLWWWNCEYGIWKRWPVLPFITYHLCLCNSVYTKFVPKMNRLPAIGDSSQNRTVILFQLPSNIQKHLSIYTKIWDTIPLFIMEHQRLQGESILVENYSDKKQPILKS